MPLTSRAFLAGFIIGATTGILLIAFGVHELTAGA